MRSTSMIQARATIFQPHRGRERIPRHDRELIDLKLGDYPIATAPIGLKAGVIQNVRPGSSIRVVTK